MEDTNSTPTELVKALREFAEEVESGRIEVKEVSVGYDQMYLDSPTLSGQKPGTQQYLRTLTIAFVKK